MISATTQFGHQTPVQFGAKSDEEKEIALRKAQQASEQAKARLSEAQQRWGNVTPAQKAGIKSVVGMILLAVAATHKQNAIIRTVALLAAAGLLTSAGADALKIQKLNRMLPKSMKFDSAPTMDSPHSVALLKADQAEKRRKLEAELEGNLTLQQKVVIRVELLQMEAIDAELDVQLRRLELNG